MKAERFISKPDEHFRRLDSRQEKRVGESFLDTTCMISVHEENSFPERLEHAESGAYIKDESIAMCPFLNKVLTHNPANNVT